MISRFLRRSKRRPVPARDDLANQLSATVETRARLHGAIAAVRSTPIELLAPRPGADPDAPLALSYPILYAPSVWELLDALATVGAAPTFDWMDWTEREQYYSDAAQMAAAPVADAMRMITAVRRAERFSDGAIAHVLANGVLLAAADSIAAHLDATGTDRGEGGG